MMELIKKLLKMIFDFVKKQIEAILKRWLISTAIFIGLILLIALIIWIAAGSSPNINYDF